jgi:hypothetical protein
MATYQLSAQNEDDAIRYARQYIVGTARAVGMGNAMGAVGGDFTSLSINPAGIGVYRKSEFTFSPSFTWNSTKSDFLGNKIEQSDFAFEIGNVGYILNTKTGREKGLVSTSFGFGYNQMNNFNQEVLMAGINRNSSLLDNYTNIYNDPSQDISDFYEGLAYDVDLIAWDSTAGEYFNDFKRGGYDQEQQRWIKTEGYTGEYIFSAGTNISNKLYIGTTLGYERARYERIIEHTEEDLNNQIDYTEEFLQYDYLLTRGYGFNMKFGVLARPLDFLRLGAAFHIPTYYWLYDHYDTRMTAWYDNNLNIPSKTAYSPHGEFDYKVQSPWKFVGSAALVINNFGLLSFDYERIDYSNVFMEGYGYGFSDENTAIAQNFKAVNNFRMGAEFRLGIGYFRGGYQIYGTPLKYVDPTADSKYSVISGGIGIRSDDYFMDISYSNGMTKEAYYMYPEMTTGSINKSNLNNIMLTMGYRF